MHPLPEARIHSGSQRYDAVLAVFLANLIHGGEGPAPVLGARLIDEAGLPFGGLERLRVDSQQPDGFTSPALMKEPARGRRQLGIDLRGVVECPRSREGRKIGVAQLDLQRARPQAM